MGFIKGIINFFGEILKDVLKKVIVFLILVGLILLALNYFLGINFLDFLRQIF